MKKEKTKEEKASKVIDPAVIEKRIRDFISSKSKMVKGDDLATDTKLFTSGLLDSLTFIQLVTFIESTFNLSLADKIEVTGENLDTINQIRTAIETCQK